MPGSIHLFVKPKIQYENARVFCVATLSLSTFIKIHAQGTAFTYQGELNSNGTPANGTYDFQFIVYDQSTGGAAQRPALTNSSTPVANGLFTVTLDFGPIFNGAPLWLDISVRTNAAPAFRFDNWVLTKRNDEIDA